MRKKKTVFRDTICLNMPKGWLITHWHTEMSKRRIRREYGRMKGVYRSGSHGDEFLRGILGIQTTRFDVDHRSTINAVTPHFLYGEGVLRTLQVNAEPNDVNRIPL